MNVITSLSQKTCAVDPGCDIPASPTIIGAADRVEARLLHAREVLETILNKLQSQQVADGNAKRGTPTNDLMDRLTRSSSLVDDICQQAEAISNLIG